jgi:hypothetical protein
LERNGYQERSLECEGAESFAVEFHVDQQHPFIPSKLPHRGRVKAQQG